MKSPFQSIQKLFKKKSTEDMEVDEPVQATTTPQPAAQATTFRAFPERFADVFGKKEKKEKNEAATTPDDNAFPQSPIEESEVITSSAYVAGLVNEVRENFAAPLVAIPEEDPSECTRAGYVKEVYGEPEEDEKVDRFVIPKISFPPEFQFGDVDAKALALEIAATPMNTVLHEADHCDNQKAMDNAVAHGVKVRDFAFAPHAPLGVKELANGKVIDERVPELFDAPQKYKEFMYMFFRVLVHSQFDLPSVVITPRDVYRLYQLRWIDIGLCTKYAYARMLLGRGAWDNVKRRRGGSSLPLYPWTVADNVRKPSPEEVMLYSVYATGKRFSEISGYTSLWRTSILNDMPYDDEWDQQHLEDHGILGLKKLGFDDETSLDFLKKEDPSFVDRNTAIIHPAPGKDEYSYLEKARTTAPFCPAVCKVPLNFANPPPLFVFPVTVEYNLQPPCESSNGSEAGADPAAANVAAPVESSTASVPEATTPEETDKAKKGKKRARSKSPASSSDEDGPARRTRARVTREIEASTPPSSNLRSRRSPQSSRQSASPRGRQARKVSQQASGSTEEKVDKRDKGKKRAREDSPDEEAASTSAETTPAKKRKAADGSATPSGSDSDAPATPSSVAAVDASIVVVDGSSAPSPVTPPQASPPRRVAAPLRRHHMRIRYYNEEDKQEGPSSRPVRRYGRKSRSPSPDNYGPWRAITPPPSFVVGSRFRQDFGEEPQFRQREDGLTDGLPVNFEVGLPERERLEAYIAWRLKHEDEIAEEEYQRIKDEYERSKPETEAALERARAWGEAYWKKNNLIDLTQDDDDGGDDKKGDDKGADHFNGAGGGDDDDDAPGDYPDGAVVVRRATPADNTSADMAQVLAAQQLILFEASITPRVSTPPASPPPAPAPAPPPAAHHPPAGLIEDGSALPEYRKLRRHPTFQYGDKLYESKGAAFGALAKHRGCGAESVPTDWVYRHAWWDSEERDRIMPGLSSYNRPMSEAERRRTERTLNAFRRQLNSAEAKAADERDQDCIELTTDGAMFDMARRLLDRRDEDKDDEEDEDEEEGKGKGKGKGKLVRRK